MQSKRRCLVLCSGVGITDQQHCMYFKERKLSLAVSVYVEPASLFVSPRIDRGPGDRVGVRLRYTTPEAHSRHLPTSNTAPVQAVYLSAVAALLRFCPVHPLIALLRIQEASLTPLPHRHSPPPSTHFAAGALDASESGR